MKLASKIVLFAVMTSIVCWTEVECEEPPIAANSANPESIQEQVHLQNLMQHFDLNSPASFYKFLTSAWRKHLPWHPAARIQEVWSESTSNPWELYGNLSVNQQRIFFKGTLEVKHMNTLSTSRYLRFTFTPESDLPALNINPIVVYNLLPTDGDYANFLSQPIQIEARRCKCSQYDDGQCVGIGACDAGDDCGSQATCKWSDYADAY